MPAKARKDIVDHDEVGTYHCFSRCVRRAFICGEDELTKKDFSYRLGWFDTRIQQLVSVFMVEVLAYAFLDNHFHSMLRIRPDLVEKLSDREVARRSLMLSPLFMHDDPTLEEPDPEAIEEALADKDRIEEWRTRLANLSWFMKYLKEPIARRANREDEVTGCFWEARFGSTRLLDAFAVTSCSLYVDLNEIRAEKADSPEQALNSTIGRRIAAWIEDRKRRSLSYDEQARESASSSEREPAPVWVAPINETSANGTVSGTMTEEVPRPEGRRPSDSGYLPMTIEQYMQLVDWAGRSLREGKRGAIPEKLAPIMDRLVGNYDAFLSVVKNFSKLFKHVCGTPESLLAYAAKTEAKKIRGLRLARLVCPS